MEENINIISEDLKIDATIRSRSIGLSSHLSPKSQHHRSKSRSSLEMPPSSDNANGFSSQQVSNQLMYPEKFTDCYREGKLRVVGKETQAQAIPRTFHMPENSVLSRIKGFLPQLSEANKSMASKLASDSSQQAMPTIEPVGLDSDTSDEEEEEEKSKETNRSAGQLHPSSPYVEMNVSLLPSEVLAKFDDSDEESSTDDEECVEKAVSVLQQNTSSILQGNSIVAPETLDIQSDESHSTKAPCIEELSSSDFTANDVIPKR